LLWLLGAFLSRDFLWELEKLRRRFGVDGDELKLAVRELTRKRRGLTPQNYTEEITRARKNRREARQLIYWTYLEELVDLSGIDSLKGKVIVGRLTELLRDDPTPHAVLLDFADCLLRRVLSDNDIWDSDRDHLERAGFHYKEFEPPDGPRRRKLLGSQMKVLETLLRELHTKDKIT
jgi:hypothetical protein